MTPPKSRPKSMHELQMSPNSNRSSTTLGDSPVKGSRSNPGSPTRDKDLDLPNLKQVKSSSNIPSLPQSPPILVTDTQTARTRALHLSPPSSPSIASGNVSTSFSENAKKRRSNLKGLEHLTLSMIQAPVKLTKHLTQTGGATTPEGKSSGEFDYFGSKTPRTPMTQEEKEKRAWEKEKRRRKKAKEKKRQEQIFVRALPFELSRLSC